MKKKIKQDPNEFAKECVIVHNGEPMMYDEESQELYFSDRYTVFPSKEKAASARWHAVEKEKAAGRVEDWKEYYKVVET